MEDKTIKEGTIKEVNAGPMPFWDIIFEDGSKTSLMGGISQILNAFRVSETDDLIGKKIRYKEERTRGMMSHFEPVV